MRVVLFMLVLLMCSSLQAQNNFDSVLTEIESNNTTLKALKQQVEAEKTENRTGLFLSNPEVGFAYMWGTPGSIGTKTNLSIMQSFDFPTAYGYKKKIADLKNVQAELQYAVELKNFRLEAKLICIQLVYQQALKAELKERLQNAEDITNAYQRMFDEGECNILELNKAKLNLTGIRNELAGINTEIEALNTELARLNGGLTVTFKNQEFPALLISSDFEEWYKQAEQNNPVLQYVKQEVDILRKQEKLTKALNMPKFSAGFANEVLDHEKFEGVSVGVSIPLWENKNTVKAAKAKVIATEARVEDARVQFYNQLKGLHAKAVNLQKTSADYKQALQTLNNTSLLKKALDHGEISLIEYLLEVQFYYETVNKSLETELQLHSVVAELEKWN